MGEGEGEGEDKHDVIARAFREAKRTLDLCRQALPEPEPSYVSTQLEADARRYSAALEAIDSLQRFQSNEFGTRLRAVRSLERLGETALCTAIFHIDLAIEASTLPGPSTREHCGKTDKVQLYKEALAALADAARCALSGPYACTADIDPKGRRELIIKAFESAPQDGFGLFMVGSPGYFACEVALAALSGADDCRLLGHSPELEILKQAANSAEAHQLGITAQSLHRAEFKNAVGDAIFIAGTLRAARCASRAHAEVSEGELAERLTALKDIRAREGLPPTNDRALLASWILLRVVAHSEMKQGVKPGTWKMSPGELASILKEGHGASKTAAILATGLGLLGFDRIKPAPDKESPGAAKKRMNGNAELIKGAAKKFKDAGTGWNAAQDRIALLLAEPPVN